MTEEELGTKVLEAAGAYLGLAEFPGARHNEQIVDMFEDVGHAWVQDDETPWCAAFVGAVLGSLGLAHTGSLAARSYMDWGQAVRQANAKPGDVVVLWRGHPTAATGHVAFLVRFDGDKVLLRGGNQGNKVSDAAYPISRVVGYRRADLALPVTGRRTLREGARGPEVEMLQVELKHLRFFPGTADGFFGPRTKAAVMEFQLYHNLGADGVVGPKTWAAMEGAAPRMDREVDVTDLRHEGSRIVGGADAVRGTGVVVGAGGTALAALEQARDVGGLLADSEGLLNQAKHIVETYWMVLLPLIAGYFLWRVGSRIIAARVEDARTGATLK